MKKYLGIGIILMVLLTLVAVPAFASVTFDPASGKGFVGKGDIQIPFGWNNQALQANATSLTFSYDSADVYDVTVEWDTGTRNIVHHTVTHNTSVAVANTVAYDTRKNKQADVTGFNLTGFGATSETGDVPEVGDLANDGNGAVVTSVVLVSSTAGTLTVTNSAGGSAVLWTAP